MAKGHSPAQPSRIGVISDTHGSLPAAVASVFEGVSLIIHAGDVGPESVLKELSVIARVEAVAGNTDHPYASGPLPQTLSFAVDGVRFFVTHRYSPAHHPAPPDTDVIVAGHTHVPEVVDVNGRMLVNPGSATRSRTADGASTVALMELGEGSPAVSIISLPEETDPHR